LPALLQASILALLSTSIPLSMTFTATLIAIAATGKIITNPSPQELRSALSIHVFAFSSLGDLLHVESEGEFSMETWDEAQRTAFMVCHGQDQDDSDQEDVCMDSKDEIRLERILRDAVQGKVMKEREWKQRPG
jgi:exosome complex component RRP46